MNIYEVNKENNGVGFVMDERRFGWRHKGSASTIAEPKEEEALRNHCGSSTL